MEVADIQPTDTALNALDHHSSDMPTVKMEDVQVDDDDLRSHMPTHIEGVPFTMEELKSVDDYLADGPPVPTKKPQLPAINSTSASSALPEGVVDNSADPILVVGERTTTNHVSDLYMYITKYHPRHQVQEFVFDEPYQQQFSVVLKLNGLEDIEPEYDVKYGEAVATPKLFPSKKHAKEFVAGLALEKLRNMEDSIQPEHIHVGPGKMKSETYLGELNQFCQKNGLSRPHIVDTSNSKAPFVFGCVITININEEATFGDANPQYGSKKQAQNAAAKAAMEYIEKTKPRIVKKSGKNSRPRVLAPGSIIEIDATSKTIGEVATEACVLLGFKAPQIEKQAVEHMEGLYDVFVTLEHHEQRAKIGPIKGVFGRKAVQTEAMKLTLRAVQMIAEQKMDIQLKITGNIGFSTTV